MSTPTGAINGGTINRTDIEINGYPEVTLIENVYWDSLEFFQAVLYGIVRRRSFTFAPPKKVRQRVHKRSSF